MKRFQVVASSLVLAAVLLTPIGSAFAQNASGAGAALTWLHSQQQPDGGFSNGFAPGSDIGATADAVIAIASAGESPALWKAAGGSPLDFLAAHAAEVTAPGLAAKVALAALAAGEAPSPFGGVDLLAVIAAGFDPQTGAYGSGPYDSALAVLAFEQAGSGAPRQAVDGLIRFRQEDGSYAFDGTVAPGSGDSNTTALVVMALARAGATDPIRESIRYFRTTQNADGGWTYQKPSAYGEATDANSTALVIQALLASGETLAAWGDPLAALEALQQPSGAFAFNLETPGDNLLATVQAIPALASTNLADVSAVEAGGSGIGSRAMLLAAGLIILLVLGLAVVLGRGEAQHL